MIKIFSSKYITLIFCMIVVTNSSFAQLYKGKTNFDEFFIKIDNNKITVTHYAIDNKKKFTEEQGSLKKINDTIFGHGLNQLKLLFPYLLVL